MEAHAATAAAYAAIALGEANEGGGDGDDGGLRTSGRTSCCGDDVAGAVISIAPAAMTPAALGPRSCWGRPRGGRDCWAIRRQDHALGVRGVVRVQRA